MSKNEKIKVYYACDMGGKRDVKTWNPMKPISCQPPPPPSGAAGVPVGGLGAAVPARYCSCKIRPLTKKIIAEIAWVDHQLSSQMIDHFDGKINLSRLELVKITLHCLNSRGMDQKYDGDLSYVLMGLLRRRPKAYITDSAFMAFARLSFANDSDRLLERMVCILPKPPSPRPNSGRVDERGRDINSPARISRNVSWIALEDHWSANLWDIEPLCQVAGIGSLHDLTQETIILDGCFGASIRWKGFARVAFGTKWSWKRDISNGLLRLALVYVIAGMLIATLIPHPVAHFFGTVLFLVGWLLVFTSPVIVQRRDTGKVWNRQPWLFGFEGHLKIETIEETLFGFYDKRLTWSAAGSTSSHHQRGAHDRREGCDPCLKTSFAQRIRDAQTASNTDERVFTLVDTGTMTALSFLAVKPPSAAIVCGQEGGMLRVALCGYDWTSNTLYRETVIRMETTVQDRMKRVGRLKFAFQRSGTLSYEVSNPSH